ncbi:hypothetical protein [Bacillus massilinigeriensis]|nr:hypothetical protein [Bacillus mediterraneensis]
MAEEKNRMTEEQETESMIDLVRIINSNSNEKKISDIIKNNKSRKKK